MITNTPPDTSVQKLHKSPDDSKLHKTQIAPDVELVELIAQELANQYGDKWDAQDFTETMHGETPEEMRRKGKQAKAIRFGGFEIREASKNNFR